jgi:hypothetical protein
VRLGVSEDRLAKKKNALNFDYSAFCVTAGIGRLAVALCRIALLRNNIGTLIHEISLLSVLYFPFRPGFVKSKYKNEHAVDTKP